MQTDSALANVSAPSLAPVVPDMQDVSDVELVRSIARGHRSAMQVLFARHSERTYRFALRLLRDRSLAEDIVSDVFLHVWRQTEEFQGRSEASTWLLTIARRKVCSELQRQATERGSVESIGGLAGLRHDPDQASEEGQRPAALSNCLARLPAEQRQVIDLVYYHRQPLEGAAEILGLSQEAAMSRMVCARKRLAQLLVRSRRREQRAVS